MTDENAAPSPRIGDAERDRAIECLQEHHAAGRLDPGEFDDRMGRALQARTRDDLDPLFVDLPAPQPFTELDAPAPASMAVAVPPSRRSTWLSPEVFSSITGLVWVAAIIGIAVFGLPGQIILIPIMLLPALGSVLHAHQNERKRQEKELADKNRPPEVTEGGEDGPRELR